MPTDIPYNPTIGSFEWDEEKARTNLLRHGVRFIDALEVFDDPFFLEVIDDRAEHDEERIRAFGFVEGRVFLVVYVLRGDIYRLISARKATKDEEITYYSHHP